MRRSMTVVAASLLVLVALFAGPAQAAPAAPPSGVAVGADASADVGVAADMCYGPS